MCIWSGRRLAGWCHVRSSVQLVVFIRKLHYSTLIWLVLANGSYGLGMIIRDSQRMYCASHLITQSGFYDP
ncbi:hypothetical protein MANES_12G072650v8 [Manihot esculenta]|uniref:Uncharacterized protein n=1 Tax=Manihot esculenta TaxID=3983 RepID=A0ACB7GPV2_MANES|nr:hypothetical protein MANES_12G072650v8 [Manihot esculenta]